MVNRNNEREIKINQFDPDNVGKTEAGIFGLPFSPEESEAVIIPVPWDVTVSNCDGTSLGPQNIYNQSPQIDLYDETVKDPWKAGIAMEPIPKDLLTLNDELRQKVRGYISALEENSQNYNQPQWAALREEVNGASDKLCAVLEKTAHDYLSNGQLPILVGGDHSTPLGLMKACAHHHTEIGILQIDAHADLRDSYMGFTHSHASIMHQASRLEAVKKITQVGLRDISAREASIIKADPAKYHPFFARNMHNKLFRGTTWMEICDEIIASLPKKVYITFDIDGLDPWQCSSTGTPVPGGLSYSQVLFLFEQLVASGRTIIGFDLVETGPAASDGIIACRILYKTIALMLQSNKKI